MSLKRNKLAFEDFLLDHEEKVLFYKKSPVPITPKTYEILHLLVTNQGHLVEKERLLNEVWKGVVVEEGSLTFTISRLRKILGDDARKPKYIETISGRGYRFIADVSRPDTDSSSDKKGVPIEKTGSNSLEKENSAKSYFVRFGLVFVVIISSLLFSGAYFVSFLSTEKAGFSGKSFEFSTLKTNGRHLKATISPDGRFFVYSNEVNEKIGIWLQEIGTSENRELIPPGNFLYFGSTFSRNSNFLYFVRRDNILNSKADIYRVLVSGGEPEKLIENTEGSIGLSPDDSQITFLRKDKKDNMNLYVADADGTNQKKLLTKEFPNHISGNSFSPDGKAIAYGFGQAHDGKISFRLIKFDLQKKIETEISSEKFYVIGNLVWMPDGKSLFFTARKSPGQSGKIRKANIESGEITEVSGDPTHYMGLSIDKSGQRMLAIHHKNSFHLAVYDLTGLREKKILTPARTAGFISNSQIAYSTNEGAMFKVGITGEGQTQLSSKNFLNWSPLLSSNGDYIFYSSNQGGSHKIWQMKTDGTEQRQITKEIGGNPAFFSADGDFLYFKSNTTSTLWQVRTDGSDREKEFWEKKMLDSVLSRDKTKIAYIHLDKSDNRRKVIELADFGKKSLIRRIAMPEKGMYPVKVDWLADNKTLLYISKDQFGNKLWRHNLDTNSSSFLFDLGKERVRKFAISPDGKKFLLISGEWFQDVVLIKKVQ